MLDHFRLKDLEPMNDPDPGGKTVGHPLQGWPIRPDQMASILGMISDLVVTTDRAGRVTWVNAAFERQSGYSLAQAVGRLLTDVTQTCDGAPTMTERAMASGQPASGEVTYATRSGVPYRVKYDMRLLPGPDGRSAGFVFLHKVVTEQRALESALRSERYFLTRMMDTGVSAVAAFDAEGRCVFANSEARQILDRMTRDQRLCADHWPLTRLRSDLADDDGDPPSAAPDDHPGELPFASVMRTGRPLHGMLVELTLPDRPRQIFSVNAAPLRDDETTARVVVSMTDITARHQADVARRKAAALARFDARHDPLTGLPNSRDFNAGLAKATAPTTVLVVDIDNYRSIRTVLGRSVGNALLCAFGGRLAQVLGQRGILARIEGSAFAIRLDNATPQAAEALAQEFHSALQHAFVLDQITVYATASIGLSHQAQGLGPDSTSAHPLLRQAELANFAATSDGGNRQARYSADMDARLSRRNAIIQALRKGLQQGQFELAFQPKFGLGAGAFSASRPGRLIGAEALLRWSTPELGRVSPDEFIPIAEAAGVISDIDFHVMGIFARQLGRWRANWLDVPASINLSPHSFEDGSLAPRLLHLLAQEGVDAQGVTVEITETALISMSAAALANIDLLRQAGVRLSIDDFGTGYSSFSYLQKLVVSEIKIDKSFVHLLPSDVGEMAAGDPTGTRTIVRSILALARTLDISVVAEGVENIGQLAWLHQEGCHAIQGYLGGRAVSPDTFERTHLRALGETGSSPWRTARP